ncbi:hypothetical protein FHW12_003670 [Dokdonella fugitiva]|uniref:Cytochrome c554/c'-like protein n=1 Tax=Dokdonella fugitiva TaxID=328517 RepID=A0A839EXK2_9GAMM|nr:hypothetical protein [Dokdonella fugitiva]MBA8889427.1 hypothetical protein [Dokdonella fugitiva]
MRPDASRLRIVASGLAALFAATAAFALDYTPHGTQPGLDVTLGAVSVCIDCHRSLDPANAGFMPHSTWGGSMMANAMRDPLFWAALDVANHDAASEGNAGVGDYCLRCHTPRGWLGGRVVKNGSGGTTGTGGESGCKLLGNYASKDRDNSDYSGVDCHYCHRLMPGGPQGEAFITGNANAWVDDALTCESTPGFFGPCRRGPYQYAAGSMLEAPHGWAYSSHHTGSAICATCHDVTTPDTDQGPLKTLVRADGTDSGRPFPIERTSTEWSRSLFADAILRDGFGDAPSGTPAVATAQPCQACHMRTSQDPLAKACEANPSGSRTGNLPVHEFAGANAWVPGIIKAEYGGNLLQQPEDYDRTIASARDMLASSATVSTTITAYTPATPTTAGSISIEVAVTNLSGHKLPTGYPEGRRMWLNLQVRSAANALVAESGAYDDATATLTEDVQARVYESLQGIWDAPSQTCVVESAGAKQFHFVLNNCIAKDNRIPPLGFRVTAPDDPEGLEAGPVAANYAETSPGSGVLVNTDRVAYTFTVPAGTTGPLSAKATLYHQVASSDYIAFLRDQSIDNAFGAENDLCAGGPGRPFTVGPQALSRGEYMYELWTSPLHGKSPPEPVATGVAVAKTGSRRR